VSVGNFITGIAYQKINGVREILGARSVCPEVLILKATAQKIACHRLPEIFE
jgi:hypothetical protein